jgi:hypothetical protein
MKTPSPWPLPKQLRQASRVYATRLGQLIFAWNNLHDNLSKLFELAVDSPSRKIGVSIWYSTESDFAQRKMLRAAIERTTKLSKPQRDDIIWMLNRIDESLRHHRNDAIHSPYVFIQHFSDTSRILVIPDPSSDSPRAKSLMNKGAQNLKAYLEENTELAELLNDYAADMFKAILNPSGRRWPNKPELPHARRKKIGRVGHRTPNSRDK